MKPENQTPPEENDAAKLEASGGQCASACSRIADPEGKHLEVCRLQLAAVVKQRDKLAEALRPFTTLNPKSPRVWKFWDGFVTKARDALKGIHSENDKTLATGGVAMRSDEAGKLSTQK
jgi:hypothetical protein